MEMMITMMMVSRKTGTTFHENDHPLAKPSWKLYENPFYSSPQKQPQYQNQEKQEDRKPPQIHRLHLPVSTRKIAASFWDLTFIKPFMESELDSSRAQIVELKGQLESERKARKKVESVNKKLAKELSGERKRRQALEKVCEELAVEITSDKAEISRLKKEMEEERKMLRVAEVLREERVQMKLAEAKILLEEKMLELEFTKNTRKNDDDDDDDAENKGQGQIQEEDKAYGDKKRDIRLMKVQRSKMPSTTTTTTLEPENPHINRGIKGFVEFPKVVRAIGSRSRHLGTKLECQKAQLMILLKHKTPIQSNNLLTS